MKQSRSDSLLVGRRVKPSSSFQIGLGYLLVDAYKKGCILLLKKNQITINKNLRAILLAS